jgi:hypothetical protein
MESIQETLKVYRLSDFSLFFFKNDFNHNLTDLFVFLLSLVFCFLGIVLNDFIRHFEPLFYDHHDVRLQHSRSKRESQSQTLHLQFNAHNR